MSACRIERKRAHDREAQRVSRARTKAYIAHLEQTVTDLSSSNADDREKQLAQRTSEQEKKIESLQCTLTKIRNLLKQVTDTEMVVGDQDSPKSSAAASSSHDYRASQSGDDTITQQELFAASPPETHRQDPVSVIKPSLDEPSAALASAQAVTRPGYAQCLGVNLQCTDADTNYFPRLSGVLGSLERLDNTIHLTTARVDDDILVRAVVFGWESAAKRHRLDVVWQFIRAFDEGLFDLMPPVERLAHMRQMRSMLLYKIQPTNQERRPIVKCFTQTALQMSQKHFSLPDYFAWPQVRNHLITSKVVHISERDCITFAKNFRFLWSYELRDAFMKHRSTGLYTFSDAFDKSYNDLGNYRINLYEGANNLGFFNESCSSPLTPASEAVGVSSGFDDRPNRADQGRGSHPSDDIVVQRDPIWSAEDLRWLSEVEVGQWLGGAWTFSTDTLATHSDAGWAPA